MNFDSARTRIELATGGSISFDPADAVAVREIEGNVRLYITGARQFFQVDVSLQAAAQRIDTLWFQAEGLYFNPAWISVVVARPDGAAEVFLQNLEFTVFLPGLGANFDDELRRVVDHRRSIGLRV
jgi:hypothetical protein